MSNQLPVVAVIGKTNAGKSSIFNRLLHTNQAIVAREAGTTRDSVIGTARHDDFSFQLIDTAGLKDPDDDFEATIQDQIDDAIGSASVILVVIDSTKYPDNEDRLIAKKALKSKKPVVLAINKTDLKASLVSDEFLRLGIKDIIRVSAEHNQGINSLASVITRHIPIVKPAEQSEQSLKLALIGRPNVGKSSLFNTLAGKQQAIVSDVVGTTRDLNRQKIRYKGETIELIDTAGIRKPGKQEAGVEKFSVIRTLKAISEAYVCLLLIDASEPATALDQRLAGEIDKAGKCMIIVVTKWDIASQLGKTKDDLSAKISHSFDFTPWAPLIFTSSVTGENVTKIFELAQKVISNRNQPTKTRDLNELLEKAKLKHPPAGLKNTHPKLRYIVQTDTNPPWFVIYGSNLKFIHWSYKRYLERLIRETYDYSGTPIELSFRDEKQLKSNRDKKAEKKPA